MEKKFKSETVEKFLRNHVNLSLWYLILFVISTYFTIRWIGIDSKKDVERASVYYVLMVASHPALMIGAVGIISTFGREATPGRYLSAFLSVISFYIFTVKGDFVSYLIAILLLVVTTILALDIFEKPKSQK